MKASLDENADDSLLNEPHMSEEERGLVELDEMNSSSVTEEEEEDEISSFAFEDTQVFVDMPIGEEFSWKRCLSFVGPGFLISVGYLDPGNWATDIEGGSRFGYQLLWVLLVSNIMAMLLQTLAVRLGLVTGKDLAQHCRIQYSKPVCIVLWILCEVAIAATDLAEILGTAVGLELLFGLPMLVGILLTAGDTLVFLIVQRYGMRKLEAMIFSLLFIITMCFVVELFFSKPDAGDLFMGFVPRINNESVYVAMGMLGATVMPHNFYLHSSIVLSRKFGRTPQQIQKACLYNLFDSALALNIAFFVNSSILIVAAAVFHPKNYEVTELQMAHNLLEGFLHSKIAPLVFGLGLFCAGQSSTLTGTMAGQIVMEGFIKWKMKPWIRRLFTRLMAIVPAVIVILLSGDKGTYRLLIFSQVILSMQLPFAIIPLIKLTSNAKIMKTFANPLWVTMASWLSATLIVALNLWLVADNLIFLLTYSSTTMILTSLLILPITLFLLVLLGHLTFDFNSLWNFWKIKLNMFS